MHLECPASVNLINIHPTSTVMGRKVDTARANPALGWRVQEQTRNQVVGGSTGFTEAASSWIGTEAPELKSFPTGDVRCRQGG